MYLLLAVPDGGLWISFTSGPVSFLKDGKITTYREHDGTPISMATGIARDGQGFIWMSQTAAGLIRFNGSKWETIGKAWDFCRPCHERVCGSRPKPLGEYL